VQLAWIPDGDHSFKPRKRSGYSEEENLALAVQQLAAFIREITDIHEVTDAGA
jgi:predicted alpha/beta-hydrolase family hydrolase